MADFTPTGRKKRGPGKAPEGRKVGPYPPGHGHPISSTARGLGKVRGRNGEIFVGRVRRPTPPEFEEAGACVTSTFVAAAAAAVLFLRPICAATRLYPYGDPHPESVPIFLPHPPPLFWAAPWTPAPPHSPQPPPTPIGPLAWPDVTGRGEVSEVDGRQNVGAALTTHTVLFLWRQTYSPVSIRRMNPAPAPASVPPTLVPGLERNSAPGIHC